MYNIDYHGWKTEPTLRDVESIVNSIRLSRRTQQVEFITGFGIIRTEVFKLLQSYSLDPSYKLGNDGVIVVTIE